MRVIKEFSLNDSIRCTLFSWNGKYIIKLEKGDLEQTYKIREMDINGMEDIDLLLGKAEFISNSDKIFALMDAGLDDLY